MTPMECERGRGDDIRVLRGVVADEVLLECKLEWLWVFEEEGVFVRCDTVTKFASFGCDIRTFVLSEGLAKSKVGINRGICEARPM